MLTDVLLLILLLVLLRAIILSGTVLQQTSHWHHHFDDFVYSSQAFYGAVSESLRAKSIPSISITTKFHSEGGVLTANREYLQVSRKGQIFSICAAPFGSGFFISCWQYELQNNFHEFIRKIPYIGPEIIKSLERKTFYQIDAEIMYKEMVRHSLLSVTQSIMEEKGLRGLEDIERSYRESTLYSIDPA